MAFCSSCGKELADSSIFCPYCGTPFERPKKIPEPEHTEQPVDYITNGTGYVEPELPEAPDKPVKQEEQIPKGLFSNDPINNAVSSNDSSSLLGETEKPKKSKKKWIPLVILLSVFLTILLSVGIYYTPYLGRQIELGTRYHVAKNNFAAYTDYSSNSILSINEELKEIYDLGYKNAYDDYVESTAATALYYANYSQYEKAIEIIDPIKDFNAYTSDKYEEVAKIVFDHGVELYNSGSFTDARYWFNMISSYSNAASYGEVCRKLDLAATSNDYVKLIKEAFSYDDVPNIENVIFKNEDLANRYLVGKWSGSGDYYFNMSVTSNGYTFTTNIPMLYHEDNDYYYFIDNKMYFHSAGLCFAFNVSSYNEMSIYSKTNGRTYRFSRK
ncbi:MAG: zinc ribbon domain-containing protein [Clostridiales bacterium]|nr:zinc ribbon domain-containing protein [Clostridiales bacterium]